MRKVTQQIRDAFHARRSLALGNTFTDGQGVWLHGNKVIERREDGIYWTLAGWPTVTTRERVNGIAHAGVYQKDWEQCVTKIDTDGAEYDAPIDPGEWIKSIS